MVSLARSLKFRSFPVPMPAGPDLDRLGQLDLSFLRFPLTSQVFIAACHGHLLLYFPFLCVYGFNWAILECLSPIIIGGEVSN